MPKYKVDTIYPDYYEVTVRHISPYKTLTDIIITFEKVVTAITSLKEAIINKSNTIMEE